MVWFGLDWFGLVWFGLVWFGLVWFGLVWFGLVRFGLVWFGLVWFGLVDFCERGRCQKSVLDGFDLYFIAPHRRFNTNLLIRFKSIQINSKKFILILIRDVREKPFNVQEQVWTVQKMMMVFLEQAFIFNTRDSPSIKSIQPFNQNEVGDNSNQNGKSRN